MTDFLPLPCALLLIDLQRAIDARYWGPRNNPRAEDNVAAVLAAWRGRGWPVVHVRHDSRQAGSAYRPGLESHAFKPQAQPRAGETVVPKQAHSAFVATDLDRRLKARGIASLCVCGVITDNSVEATVRHGADLGWPIALIEDACFTVDRRLRDGRIVAAADMHERALALLEGEYAAIATTAQALDWVAAA
ncbi:MAG: cysteine hydrolase family protein [Reyranellaceae bacterium]